MFFEGGGGDGDAGEHDRAVAGGSGNYCDVSTLAPGHPRQPSHGLFLVNTTKESLFASPPLSTPLNFISPGRRSQPARPDHGPAHQAHDRGAFWILGF